MSAARIVSARVFPAAPACQAPGQNRAGNTAIRTCQAYKSALLPRKGRRDYIRCRLVKNPGASPEYDAVPLMAPSAVISGLVEADGLVVCPENSEGFAAGEVVQALLVS